MIQIKSITKTYGKKQNIFQALSNVSLEIPDGASVAILGKSGSGKSTLMHAMSGLDRPETGQVIINGQDILQLKAKDVDTFRSKTIGFIFQAFFVQGNETCYDNVSLPLEIAKVPKSQRKALVEEALTKVDLADKIKERAKNLSGGQKQRLAIARAIVNNPSIIFADEPTGNLDSATGEMVEQLLFDYNKKSGTTLVIVTHDPDLANKCNMQVHIKDGQIEAVKGVAPTVRATQPQPASVAAQGVK
ncbi:MAG TPA: ABC transporter ATP-binding protein [Candidatus Saccharimonadales bacterium]|nr:ABC transporter ATP-binding protein [Candidatus Saccharimonadales bacterium]